MCPRASSRRWYVHAHTHTQFVWLEGAGSTHRLLLGPAVHLGFSRPRLLQLSLNLNACMRIYVIKALVFKH